MDQITSAPKITLSGSLATNAYVNGAQTAPEKTSPGMSTKKLLCVRKYSAEPTISAIAKRAASVLTRINPGRLTVRVGLIKHRHAQFPRRMDFWSMAGPPRNLFNGRFFPAPECTRCEHRRSAPRCGSAPVAIEERDRQAVEFFVRRLGDHPVDDLGVGVFLQPLGDVFTHHFSVPRERRGEHLDSREDLVPG